MKERNVAVNLIVPGHTRTTGSDEQAAARQSLGGGSGALSLRPDHVVPLALFLAQQNAGGGPTGRCFDTVAWNIEHGLGGPEAWADAGAASDSQQAPANGHPPAS